MGKYRKETSCGSIPVGRATAGAVARGGERNTAMVMVIGVVDRTRAT